MCLVNSCLIALAVMGVSQAQESGSADKDRLQGLWQAIKGEAHGHETTKAELQVFQIRIKDNVMTFLPDNRSSTFELDASKKPKTIDFIPNDGPAKGMKVPAGIYSLNGDELILCLNNGDAPGRPSEFKTRPGGDLRLLVLQRVKARE
jgi:uncharacterized protein (TIGR03067 family)